MKGDIRAVEKGSVHTRLSACCIQYSCTMLLEGTVKVMWLLLFSVSRFYHRIRISFSSEILGFILSIRAKKKKQKKPPKLYLLSSFLHSSNCHICFNLILSAFRLKIRYMFLTVCITVTLILNV